MATVRRAAAVWYIFQCWPSQATKVSVSSTSPPSQWQDEPGIGSCWRRLLSSSGIRCSGSRHHPGSSSILLLFEAKKVSQARLLEVCLFSTVCPVTRTAQAALVRAFSSYKEPTVHLIQTVHLSSCTGQSRKENTASALLALPPNTKRMQLEPAA